MASADQIKALIRSHFEHDDDRFSAVAMQVAAHMGRREPVSQEVCCKGICPVLAQGAAAPPPPVRQVEPEPKLPASEGTETEQRGV